MIPDKLKNFQMLAYIKSIEVNVILEKNLLIFNNYTQLHIIGHIITKW